MTSLDKDGGRSRETNDLESSSELVGSLLVRARGSASHSGRPTEVPAFRGCDGLLSR